MRLLLLSPLVIAAVGACAVDNRVVVTGTWTAHTTWAEQYRGPDCPKCAFWMGLDVFENPQGIVTGVMGGVSSGGFDVHADAAYVLGTRRSDSVAFVVQPCDSGGPESRQHFRGRLSPSGDTLYGDWREQITLRSQTDSFRASLVFKRGAIDDTVMVRAIEWLARTCRPAA